MLKSLVICFAVLFAQLAVLHVIDVRLNNSPDARQTATSLVTAHKEEGEGENEEEVKQG